jgi:hypothetical protein
MNFSMNTRSSAKLDLASLRAEGDPHALAAAAGRGLDHHRIADVAADLDRLRGIIDQIHMTGHGADSGLLGQAFGFDLVTHGGDGRRRWSDEHEARCLKRRDEGRIFCQETEARMHGHRPARPAGLHDLVDHQIAFRRGRGADGDRLVRQIDVQGPLAKSTCRAPWSASE